MPPAVHPYSIFNLIWECSSSRLGLQNRHATQASLGLGITDFDLTFGVQKAKFYACRYHLGLWVKKYS